MNAQASHMWTCDENRSHITISPISIFIAVQRHSLTMLAAVVWNSSGFDRTPSRFPFGSRRWYRRISGELHAVDLPRSTLSTSSSEIGNTFCFIRLSIFGGHFRECSTRCRSGEPFLRYFRRSKFPREPCVRKADMILREFN